MKGFDNRQQAETAINLAIGRIFRLGSRPTQAEDIQQYENAKDIILDAAEYLGIPYPSDQSANYARDYSKMYLD